LIGELRIGSLGERRYYSTVANRRLQKGAEHHAAGIDKPSPRHPSAIDRNRHAGDRARFIAGEINDGAVEMAMV
jgi:hypothetical protein